MGIKVTLKLDGAVTEARLASKVRRRYRDAMTKLVSCT